MKKLINFKGLVFQIQGYANDHYDGNFSMAVRMLVKKGLGKAAESDGDSHLQEDLLK